MNRTRTRCTLIALREARLPTPSDVCSAYKKSFPNAGTLVPDAAAVKAPGSAPGQDSEESVVRFRTPTCNFTVTLVHAPIAWSELRGPCAAAWYWPEARMSLETHGAHLLVTASSNTQDAIELMLSLTRVVAAVASCAPALGVFLRGAAQVHKVEDFVSEAEGASREMLPLYLWVKFSLTEDPDGRMTLCTTGLEELELMEIEIPHTRFDPQTLMDRAFNIAHYLLDQGAVLAPGHTIGISAEEKFKVSHAPSILSSRAEPQASILSSRAEPHASTADKVRLVYQLKLM